MIPLSFFLTAPLAVAAAGAVLLHSGSAAFASGWSPTTLALAHLGTLGMLGMVMLGALYQMTPVVAGSAVPWVRLAHAVHALLVVGLVGLVVGIWRSLGEPVLAGVSAWFDCAARQLVDAGDHVIMIGEVRAFETGVQNGLGYARGSYFTLGLERLCPFGQPELRNTTCMKKSLIFLPKRQKPPTESKGRGNAAIRD